MGLQVFQFIATFLGGSMAVFLLQWVKDALVEKQRRHFAYIEQQLRELYGPLHFFVNQNESFLECNDKVHSAYKDFFEGKKWPPEADERIEQQATETIDLANAYIQKVRENNQRIVEIIQSRWYLIDIDDIEIFSAINVHFTRDVTECQNISNRNNIPLSIRLGLGNVHFYHSDWAQHVKRKWTTKRQELSKYMPR